MAEAHTEGETHEPQRRKSTARRSAAQAPRPPLSHTWAFPRSRRTRPLADRHHRAQGGHRRHHRRVRPARHGSPSTTSTPPAASPGRKVELVIEEETNPKDSIERLRKLVLQDKVGSVQGIVSSGVSLAMGAARRGHEGAPHLLGRDDAGRREADDAQPALRLPQHRQRMRSGDGRVARDQALEGPVQERSPGSIRTTRTAATTSPRSRRCSRSTASSTRQGRRR